MGKLEKIQNEILSLSVEERELIGIFVKNTQNPIDPDYQDAWQRELQTRLHDIKNGDANLVSTKSVIADLRNKLSK